MRTILIILAIALAAFSALSVGTPVSIRTADASLITVGGGAGSGPPADPPAAAGTHDFTDLPLTEDGWTDIDTIVTGAAYADSRFIYVSTSGNDGTCSAHAQGDAALGGQPLNPTGSVDACATLSTAFGLLRDGQADVLLLKRGDTFSGEDIQLDSHDGVSASARYVIAAYGSESTARPVIDFLGNSSRFNPTNYGIISSIESTTGSTVVLGRGNYLLFEDIYWNSGTGGSGLETPITEGEGNAVRRCATSNRIWFVFLWNSNAVGSGYRIEENTIDISNQQHNIYADAANGEWFENQSLRASGAAFRNRNAFNGGTEGPSHYFANLAVGDPNASPNDSSYDLHRGNLIEYNALMHADRNYDIWSMRSNTITENIATKPNGTALSPAFNFRSNSVDTGLTDHQGANSFSDNVTYDNNGGFYAAFSFGSGEASALTSGSTMTLASNKFITSSGEFTLASIANDPDVTVTANGESVYFHPGSTGNWFSGLSYGDLIPSTGSAAASATAPFSDPDRTIQTYMNQYGSYASNSSAVAAYAGNALSNRRGSWDDRWTARAMIDYLRAGFDKSAVPASPTL